MRGELPSSTPALLNRYSLIIWIIPSHQTLFLYDLRSELALTQNSGLPKKIYSLKIIHLGRNFILFQGHWTELKASRPDLFERHGFDPRPSEAGLVESRTAQERWKLLKNVAKFGIARNFPKQVRNSKLANKPSIGAEIETSRMRKVRGSSSKNNLARTALMRSAENAAHHHHHLQNQDQVAAESKKLLLSERLSVLSVDLDLPRNLAGGEASFALRRMLSTDSTTGMSSIT